MYTETNVFNYEFFDLGGLAIEKWNFELWDFKLWKFEPLSSSQPSGSGGDEIPARLRAQIKREVVLCGEHPVYSRIRPYYYYI